jgi:hypothetical protein
MGARSCKLLLRLKRKIINNGSQCHDKILRTRILNVKLKYAQNCCVMRFKSTCSVTHLLVSGILLHISVQLDHQRHQRNVHSHIKQHCVIQTCKSNFRIFSSIL